MRGEVMKQTMDNKLAKHLVWNITLIIIYIPLMFICCLAVAWIPMLAWNHGIHSIFPQVPSINYWQAFWLSNLSSWIIHRPEYKAKE